jgi:hypothetical protein
VVEDGHQEYHVGTVPFFAKNIEYLCIAALYEELYEARKDL